MSIATEITRIQNAKGSIKEAINSLGATIKDSDTIDSYATTLSALPVHNTGDATVAANRLPKGDIAYGSSGKVTGTVTVQGATTITPSSTAQVITAPKFLTGNITISAVSSTPTEGETKFYQCISSNNGTWVGFEMIKDNEGCYSISASPTSSLTYTSITPEYGGVYDEDATLKIDYYKTKIIVSGTPSTISGTAGTAISDYVFRGTEKYVTASDGKSDQITATSSNLPSGLSISNGSIIGTPTVVGSGNIQLTLSRVGAVSQMLTIPYQFESSGGELYPEALLVEGAGNPNVNGIYDFTTVQSADAPTLGDKWCMYDGDDRYCIKLIGSYQTAKRYALYANNTSAYAYYADTVTGNEWPDDPSLTWTVYNSSYGGSSPAPTSVTATAPRVVLSRISAVSNTSNTFTFVSYNCPYTNSSSVPTADALYTCMQGTKLWQLKVEQTGGKYYWSMYDSSYNTVTPMFKTFIGATSLSALGWPWDRTDWNSESTVSGIPVPEFSNLDGTETQNKGSFTDVASVWKTSRCDGIYTCHNYDINSATCKPYARFEATINGFNWCMYYNGSKWVITDRTGTATSTPIATATVSGSGESRTVPYPWDCTWSMGSSSTQVVPIVIKGDGSDGGINYGDFIVETGSSTTRFVYSNGSVINVSAEPKTTDIWTSQDGTKTISWDSTNKWWVYKNGTTSVYHTPAYTSATPYQFPWEYASDSWIAF